MAATKKILAFDLGAESGRGLLGLFDGKRLSLEVIHRFANGPVQTLDALHWDILRLYSEMVSGMRKAAAEHGTVASIFLLSLPRVTVKCSPGPRFASVRSPL